MRLVVEESIVGALRALPLFRELVGDRIYDSEAPQDEARPRVVYSLTSRRPVKSLSGNSGLYASRYELTIYAPKKSDVRRLARVLQLRPDQGGVVGLRGSLLGTNISWVWVDEEVSGLDPTTESGQKGLPFATLDVVVWSSE